MLCINPNQKGRIFKKTSLGSFVKGSVRLRRHRRNDLKKKVNWCFVLSTKRKLVRRGGEGVRFKCPKVILVGGKKSRIIGTRVRGAAVRELARGSLEDLAPKISRFV